MRNIIGTSLSRRAIILTLILLTAFPAVWAQVKIGNNPTTINPSALLELESTNKGLLLPRIADTALLNALNPPDGLLVYIINAPDNEHLYVRHSSRWDEVQTTLTVTMAINAAISAAINGSAVQKQSISSPDASITIIGGDTSVFRNVLLLVDKNKVVTDSVVSRLMVSTLVLDSLASAVGKGPFSDSLVALINKRLLTANLGGVKKAGNGLSLIGGDSLVLGGNLGQSTVIDLKDNNFILSSSSGAGKIGLFQNNPDHQLHIGVSPDQIKIDSLTVNTSVDSTRDYVLIGQTAGTVSTDPKIIKAIPVNKIAIQEKQSVYTLSVEGLGGGSASYLLPFPGARAGNTVTVDQMNDALTPELTAAEDTGFAITGAYVAKSDVIRLLVKTPQKLSGTIQINIRVRN